MGVVRDDRRRQAGRARWEWLVTGDRDRADPARVDAGYASLESLAMLPVIGHLIELVLIPVLIYDSIGRDAVRTGRSVASIALWALLWPLATVVALMLPSVLLWLVRDAAQPGSAESTVSSTTLGLMWLVVPVVAGVVVAARARALGGFGVGTVGLLIGGALVGLGAWVVVALTSGPDAAVGYIPLMTVLIPLFTAPQFGAGVVLGSVLRGLRS
jgi:hypothetical protein